MGLGELTDSLKANQYFGAGFGLIGVGTALAVSRKLMQYSLVAFRRYCMSTLEVETADYCQVTNLDPSYHWLQNYIVKRHTFPHVSLSTQFTQNTSSFEFIPATGIHYFWHKGQPIKVERSRENRHVGGPFETVTLTKLGGRDKMFTDILTQACDEELKSGMTVIYTAMASWQQFGHPRVPRCLDSVILQGRLSEKIMTDVRGFISSEEWYRARGVPYRRGYLLQGPPGCGKSSYIFALAGQLGYNLCLLSATSGVVSDDRLIHLLSSAPLDSLILIEDIDSFFPTDTSHSLTFSGLLNALDGIMASEGRIIFMTTNHPHRLDPALIRPGRVDMTVEIGYCDSQQVISLFSRFYPDSPHQAAKEFADKLLRTHPTVSPAHVQGIFLQNKDDYRFALNHI